MVGQKIAMRQGMGVNIGLALEFDLDLVVLAGVRQPR